MASLFQQHTYMVVFFVNKMWPIKLTLTLVYMASNLNRLVNHVDSFSGKTLTCVTMLNEC